MAVRRAPALGLREAVSAYWGFDERAAAPVRRREGPGRVDLSPAAAHSLFRLPLHELADRAVPFESVVAGDDVVERLHDADGWDARFAILDDVLSRKLAAAPPPDPVVVFAWRRLQETGGRLRASALGPSSAGVASA